MTPDGVYRPAPTRRAAIGIWRMSRPEQVLLILVVYGAGVASGLARYPEATPGGALWAAIALVAVAVSVHVVNEYADAQTDRLTRRTPFSGGSGALIDLGLPRRLARDTAMVTATMALVLAVTGLLRGTLTTLAVGLLLAGLLGGWWYSVGPYPLSRHGYGEVANAALGGLLLPLYGVASVAGQIGVGDVAVWMPFTLVAFVNLLETQWPDREADRTTGKRTLTTRLSARGVRVVAALSVASAYVLVLVLTPDPLPAHVAVASLTSLPLSLWGLHRLTRTARPLPSVLAMVVMVLAQGIAWAMRL